MVRRIARAWSWSWSWLIVVTVLALSLTMGTGASAGVIIWVTENTDAGNPPSPDDSGFTDLLTAQGHTVDRRVMTALDAGMIADMEAADLVIVSRDTNSGNYTQGSEVADWNAVTTPLMQVGQYLVRNSRWKWLDTGGNPGTGDGVLEVEDASHPIFAGLGLSNGDTVDIATSSTPLGGTGNIGNGQLLAVDPDNNNVAIAYWDTGTEFYSGAGQTAGGPRLFLGAGLDGDDPKGAYNLTADGQTIFLNALDFLMPAELVWDGTAGNFWSDDAHWTGPPPPKPQIPDATATAIVNGGQPHVAVTDATTKILQLNGGELVLDPGSQLTVVQALEGAAGTTLTMGAGSTLIVGEASTIGTLRTAGSATVGGAGDLTVSGATFDDQGISGTFTKTGAGTLTLDNSSGSGVVAGNTTFLVDQGTLHAIGAQPLDASPEVILDGSTLVVQGAPAMVNLLQASRWSHDGNEGTLNMQGTYTDDGSGTFSGSSQLLSATPTETAAQTGALNYNENMLSALFGLSGNQDQYQAWWTGYYNAEVNGDHVFGIFRDGGGDNIDDHGSLYLDANRDGSFDASEGFTTAGQGTQTYALTAGLDYAVAFGFNEDGGGDRFSATFQEPAGGTFTTVKTTIDPSAQGTLWTSSGSGPIDMTGTQVTVTDDSTVEAITDVGAAFGTARIHDTKALTTRGGDMTVNSLGLDGTGTLDVENQVAVLGYNDGGATRHLIKEGGGLLSVNNLSGASVSAGGTTFEVRDGTLHGLGQDPLGGSPELILAGGTTIVEGAPVTVGAIGHFGYHINDDAAALDLNANGGMMGGGNPTLGPSYFGQAQLTDGPDGNGLEFDNDAEFVATGAIGQNDNYSNLWVGMLHVDAANAGDWQFRHERSDDRAGIWLDLDQDGVFESTTSGLGSNRGEQLRWESTSAATVGLTPGDYLVAFTHREGSGGSNVDFFVKSPTMSGEEIVKPTSPGQFGVWAPLTIGGSTFDVDLPGAIDMTGTDVTVTGDAALQALSQVGADFGALTVQGGIVTASGAPMSFTDARAIGTGGVDHDIPITLGGFHDQGVAGTFIKRGPATLSVSNATPGSINATQTTFQIEAGLFDVAPAADPLGPGTHITLAGGTAQFTGQSVPGPIVPNPVAHWALDESGGTTALDSTGNHPGTLVNGAVWQPGAGVSGGALLLDGSNDYVDCGTNIDLTNKSFSTSFWVNRDTLDTDWVIGQGDTGALRQALHIGFRDADSFGFAFYGDDLGYDSVGPLGDTDNWHNYVCTYDADTNTQRLYLDGALVDTEGTGDDFQSSGSNTLWLGRRWNGQYYAGLLDEVYIFDSVLSDAEAANLFANSHLGALDLTSSNVRVTDDSVLNAQTDENAAFGSLALESGSLTVQGAREGVSFTSASIAPGASAVGLNTVVDTTIIGPMDGGGSSATFSKTGGALLNLPQGGTNMGAATVEVSDGTLNVGADTTVGSLAVSGQGTVATGVNVVTVNDAMTLGGAGGYATVYTATSGSFGVSGPVNAGQAETVILGGPGSVLTIDNTRGTLLSGDVGNPGQSGTLNEAPTGTYTIEGGGSDIWGNADSFFYAYQPISGNAEMIALVTDPENTNGWAKVGLMVRESLDDGSKNAFIARTPTTGEDRIAFQRRDSTGGGSASEHINEFFDANYWLRIVRDGDTFSGFWAPDLGGIPGAWTQMGASQNVTMGADVFIGMAVTSHNNGTLCTTAFSDVTGFAFGDFPALLNNLTGEGTVVADKGIVVGGVLGPAQDGTGIITMQGDLAFGPAATFEVDVAGFGAGEHDSVAFAGTGNSPTLNGALLDLLTPLGTFGGSDVGSLLTLMDLEDPQAFVEGFFTDPDTGLPIADRSIFFDGNEAYTWQIFYTGGDGNDVVLRLNAVPEPATLTLLGLGALGLIRRRRRRA